MSAPKTFQTERLLLRPTILTDAAFIFELLNTPKFHQYIGDREVSSVKAAEDYINLKILPQLEKLGFSNYTVIRISDKAKLGTCGLYDRPGIEGIDIGFAFLPAYEKQGYALEASCEIMRAASEDFGLTHLNAITSIDNFASQKLLEKLGLICTTTMQLPGEQKEVLLYEINLLKDK